MKYRDIRQYKYQLVEDFTIVIPEVWSIVDNDINHKFIKIQKWSDRKRCAITIREGYSWNGASGPVIDSKKTKKASMVHDALYQLLREGAIDQKHKRVIDSIFRRLLVNNNYNEFLAFLYELGLNYFGSLASKKGRHKEPQIIDVL